MPIYEYGCDRCGQVTDVLKKLSDPDPTKCSHCGAEGALSKLVSKTSFVLKGGGWYSDLYGSKKKDTPSTTTSTPPPAAADKASTSTSSTPASTPSTPAAGGSSGGSGGEKK